MNKSYRMKHVTYYQVFMKHSSFSIQTFTSYAHTHTHTHITTKETPTKWLQFNGNYARWHQNQKQSSNNRVSHIFLKPKIVFLAIVHCSIQPFVRL